MMRKLHLSLKFLSAALLTLGLGSSLQAQGFDECYYLQWGYDDAWGNFGLDERSAEEATPAPTPESSAQPGDEDMRFSDYYTWYCQAKPARSPTWNVAGDSRFHSYKPVRLDARDQALFRCERYASRCVARCALAPKSCSPHFWP